MYIVCALIIDFFDVYLMSVDSSITTITAAQLKQQVLDAGIPTGWIEDILELNDDEPIQLPTRPQPPRPKAPTVVRPNERAFTPGFH